MKITVEKLRGVWTVTIDGNIRTFTTVEAAFDAIDLAMSMAKTKEGSEP
jgi:hypothetical protein